MVKKVVIDPPHPPQKKKQTETSIIYNIYKTEAILFLVDL